MAKAAPRRHSPTHGATADSPITSTDSEIQSSRRLDLLALLIVVGLTALVSWHRLWLQNGLNHLDIAGFYLPWYAYMGEQLRNFTIPGWNPAIFSGTVFAADPQSGWMYLPAMFFFTLFDSVRAYELFLIFHLLLAGIATYCYARVIGLRLIAALTAAIAYEFGPFVNHISCCLIHVQLAVWIPVALLGVELSLRATAWTTRAAAWTLTGFAISQMIAGWIGQGVYNGMLVVGGYIAFRVLFTAVANASTAKARFWRLVFDGGGPFFLGVGLSAAGLLPRLDVVKRTNLAGGEYSGHENALYSGGWSLLTLIDRFLSDDNGFLSLSFYLGAPIVALMLIAVYLARTRYYTPFYVLVTLLTAVMTLTPTSLHDLVYALLPRYEVLHEHVPSRILAVQWIGPAMLAGIGIEMLLRERDRQRIRHAAIIAMAAAGVGVLYLITEHSGVTFFTIFFAILAALLVLALAHPAIKSGNRFARSPQLFACLLALIVFVDPAGRGLIDTLVTGSQSELLAIPTGPVDRDATPINASKTDEGGAGEFFQDLQASGATFRYFGYNYALKESGFNYPSTYREYYWLPEAQALLVNARALPLGLNDIQGYNPMQLSNYINAILFANHQEQNYHDSQIMPTGLDSPILDLLNAEYIIIPNKIPPGRPRPDIGELLAKHETVFRNDEIRVLKNEDALPRAWIVHDVVRTTDNFGLMMIDSGLVDPATTAFVASDAPRVTTAPLPAGQQDSVTITGNDADEMTLTVNAAADGLLIISGTYDPEWTAYLDGNKVELYQVDGVVRGIAVPAGEHTVKLAFEPVWVKLGLAVSTVFAAITALILLAFAVTRLRHRQPIPAAVPV